MRSRSRPSPLLLVLPPAPIFRACCRCSQARCERDGRRSCSSHHTEPDRDTTSHLAKKRKKKECLSSASRHQSCAAGSTTAAMLLRNMQSDGTAQILTVCMIRYTTRDQREESTGSSRCRLQIADCRLQSGAWNLRPAGVVILLCPYTRILNGSMGRYSGWTDGPHAHAENPGTADQAREEG